jgi:hypothetical protein
MSAHVLGIGQVNWLPSERVSDRYGVVGLYDDAHWQSEFDTRGIIGRVGTLRAVVLETRESDHIGDLFHGWLPGGAQVGDVVDLGVGRFFGERNEHGYFVGVEPADGRRSLWLDGPALYKCHSQTVRLEFVCTSEVS